MVCDLAAVMSRSGEVELFTYHHHRRPDSFRDALPQLCGGARFVESAGELPRLGWSRSHGVVHLSLGCLRPKAPDDNLTGKAVRKKKKAEIRRPGLSAVRKGARWHRLSCHYAMRCIITSNLLNTLPKKGSVIEHTSSNSSKARNTLSRSWRFPTRKQTRPLRQCGNRRWDRTVNKFITKCLGGFII